MVSQRLMISPCGMIRGGTIGFSCHPRTGELYYSGEVRVKHWIFTKSHRFAGQIQINPRKLRSENIFKGLVINCQKLKVSVETRYDFGADVFFELQGAHPGTGTAHFDLSGEYVRLVEANGEGVIRNSPVFGDNYIQLMVEDGD